MPMVKVVCPHCGHSSTQAANENIKGPVVGTVCQNCHKSFKWQNDHGTITTSKL